MMNYYEELGLDRKASPEQIRLAYKRVALLLHPDRCDDEAVRHQADIQMRRLNGILSTLTNVSERASYDRSLTPRRASEGSGPCQSCLRMRRFGLPTAGIAGLAILMWLVPARPPAPLPQSEWRPETRPLDVLPKFAATRKLKPMTRARTVQERHDSASPELDEPADPSPPLSMSTIPLSIQPDSDAREVPADTQAVSADPPSRQGLTGDWLYAAETKGRALGLYPPVYIELRLTKEHGMIRGHYRARYRINDQPISPDVVFHFETSEGKDAQNIPWAGAGGSRGEVSLHMLANGSLEVTWKAIELGSDLGLISGTATLIRKLN